MTAGGGGGGGVPREPREPPQPTGLTVYTHPSSKHLGALILHFLVSASSAAAPSDRLAAVRIEEIKGEVTVMSTAACFLLS